MSKFYFLVILAIMTFVAFTGYAQKPDSTTQKPIIKKIDFQPSIIVPYDEEDVDELLKDFDLDELDMEFGIGGDELIPASDIYSTWSNLEVNPYIAEPITDTLPISLIGFNFPLPKFYRVTSEFGQRRYRYHYGIDLKVEVGDTVVSSLGGMVRIAQTKNRRTGYGNYVVIRHFNGLETFYAHLDKVLVKPNQMVTCGEVIGLGGNTGRSTGPHLHYELRYQGKPINPRDVIDFDSVLNVKNDTLLLTASHFVYPKKSSKVSSSKKAKTVASSGKAGVWTVKRGDTLSKIAQRTGRSINALCQLNGITRNTTLKIGRKIKY